MYFLTSFIYFCYLLLLNRKPKTFYAHSNFEKIKLCIFFHNKP